MTGHHMREQVESELIIKHPAKAEALTLIAAGLISITIVRHSMCVSWMLMHERGALLAGSIERMNKMALEFVTTKYNPVITVDSPEAQLSTQSRLHGAQLIMFATVGLIPIK